MYISGIRYTSAALSLYLKNRRSIFILSATNLVIFTGTDGMFPQKNHLSPTALSFKTTSIILVILRKTIIFAHSDAGSTASGVSFYRSYKIIFVGGNQMRQRSFFDFRLNFRYAKIRFILLICNILHV